MQSEVKNMKNTEYLNRMIAYWQDLVYYYTDTKQLDKTEVAERQLNGYMAVYHNI